MADAWSTVVAVEPEWNDYTRSRAIALVAWEAGRCPNCGNYDALVPLKADRRNVRWTQHGDRKVEVAQYRCLYCGAADVIRRDWNAKHEKDKTVTGKAAPGDGRMFIPRPVTEED